MLVLVVSPVTSSVEILLGVTVGETQIFATASVEEPFVVRTSFSPTTKCHTSVHMYNAFNPP